MPATRSRTALRLGAATVCAVGAVGFATSSGTANAASTDSASYLAALNSERVAHGLRPLTLRTDLDRVAQGWAAHMAAAGVLSHNPALASAVTNWQAIGENVGDGPTVADLTAAFWASPEHRANILDRTYTDVGIATATDGNGTLWITVDFRDPMSAEPAATIAMSGTTSTTAHRVTATRRVSTRPVLRIGSRGRAVARVQRTLRVQADGVFGPQTRRAVIRFQRRHNLHVTGVVTAPTWHALHV